MATVLDICEDWTFSRNLGSGGFGIVQLWIDTRNNRRLAIKKCKWDTTQLTELQKDRWANEVKIMERLNHPNIVKTENLPLSFPGKDLGLPILCMEYCRKGDLRKVLNKTENCCGVTESEAITIMSHVASAVEYLHSYNITHRDLKPENIVLQNVNNVITYKLIDLGYAKELGEASTSASIVGTLNYLAPELLWKERYSCSVDYWSLGILFYEVVTGKRPFLPQMQHTMTWMLYIKNKSYDDIYAYESEGKVIFGKTIENPTNLSSCLKNKLEEWFRVVLQFDPKRRGRICDISGRTQLVVFQLLQTILSKKILYIFYASFYKMDTFEVDSCTTIGDLQTHVEMHGRIPISEQTITDYYGSIVSQKTGVLLAQVHNPVVFVFKSGSLLVENVAAPNIPAPVHKMLENCRKSVDFQVMKTYYSATIFFMRQEINLFQLYVFAVSIRVDLVNIKLNDLNSLMENGLLNMDKLVNLLKDIQIEVPNKPMNDENRDALKIILKKVENLTMAANQMKHKYVLLIQDYDKLKIIAQNSNSLQALSESYDKVLNMYETFKKNTHQKNTEPKDVAKQVFKFLGDWEVLFHSQSIKEINRRIVSLEDNVLKLKESFDSVVVMTHVYQEQLYSIRQCEPSHLPQVSNSILLSSEHISGLSISDDTDENVIYDNLVIRHTLDNLMIQIQKKCMEMLRLD